VLIASIQSSLGVAIGVPEFSLLDVGKAQLPVLLRIVDALQKTFPLRLLLQMEEEFDDAGAVLVEVPFQVHDGTVATVPQGLVAGWGTGDALAAEQLGMGPDDQHLLVIESVEDADPPALGQVAGGAPEKVVLQLGGLGCLKLKT